MNYLSVCSGIEAASVAWMPIGWTPVAFSEIEPFACSLLAHHYPEVPNMGDITCIDGRQFLNSVDILVGGGRRVRGSALQVNVEDCKMHGAGWPTILSVLSENVGPDYFSGKTSVVPFQLTAEGISGHSSGRWLNAGIVLDGACLTLSSSECPRDVAECSLSDILEADVPSQKYFLSGRACAGLLRREGRRGRLHLVSRAEGRLLSTTERCLCWSNVARVERPPLNGSV